MRLPAPLLRNNPNVYKNEFGHVLILAGSRRMLGAGALTSLAAMRMGAGLVTLGIPDSLNEAAQRKIANTIMTLPLKETREQTLSEGAFAQIQKAGINYNAIAIGPGISTHPSTQKLVHRLTAESRHPMVLDADALNALADSGRLSILSKTPSAKILTPHPGELARLLRVPVVKIEKNRQKAAKEFAKAYRCVLVLKGHRTVVADHRGQIYTNYTGNAGMATAGSGDVLTGMIAALLGQTLPPFEAAKWGVYLHGRAGDLAAKEKSRAAMIASDIIDCIPKILKTLTNKKAYHKIRHEHESRHR